MPSSSPSRSSTRTTVPQIQVMSPPRPGGGGGGKPRREPRDTGFPEPFDEGRNTTLPHPEADLSPNASISQEEVAVDRALKRRRLFFLNKHKKTISHGLITPQMEALHSVQSLAATAVDSRDHHHHHHRLVSQSTSSLRLSKDGADSLRLGRYDDDDDTPPTSPDVSEHRRKKGLLGRLRRKS